MRIDGEEYRLQAGDFCLHPDTLSSEYGCDREPYFTLWALRFEAKLWNTSLFEWLKTPFVVHLPPEKREKVEHLFSSLEGKAFTERSVPEVMAEKGGVFLLLSRYLQEAHATPCRRKGRIGDVLQYIDTHIDKPLSVAEVASFVSVTPDHFAHYFRAKTGISPARYIADRRRMLAENLLRCRSSENIVKCGSIGTTRPMS